MRNYGCAVAAAVATAAVCAWQTATVTFNYQGNWTALFCTGDTHRLPPEVAQGTYIFRGSDGYDGQYYRLVARSPWKLTDMAPYVDGPAYRAKRILVPAAAWLLGGGAGSNGTDVAYIVTVLISVFLGTYAVGHLLRQEGLSEWAALAFPLLPGALITIDRMTVDLGLYALFAVLLAFGSRLSFAAKWILLALCPLVRELGFLAIAATVLVELVNRNLSRAFFFAVSVMPAAGWYVWVESQLRAAPSVSATGFVQGGYHVPKFGILQKMIHPVDYILAPWARVTTQVLDFVALLSLLAAVLIALYHLRERKWTFPNCLQLGFVGAFFVVNYANFFQDVFSYPRAFTPLLGLVAFEGLRRKSLWHVLPLAGVTARVVWQLGPQIQGIFLAVTHRI